MFNRDEGFKTIRQEVASVGQTVQEVGGIGQVEPAIVVLTIYF
jgi:hypothetical protein